MGALGWLHEASITQLLQRCTDWNRDIHSDSVDQKSTIRLSS